MNNLGFEYSRESVRSDKWYRAKNRDAANILVEAFRVRADYKRNQEKGEINMNRVIYKYNLGFGQLDRCEVNMRVGAKILSIQQQDGCIRIWAMVDPDAEGETRSFTVRGTGKFFTPKKNEVYIGTVQIDEYVWHIFEEK